MPFDSALSRRTLLVGAGATTLLSAFRASAAAPAADRRPLIGPASAPRLHVMSYNLRFDKPGTKPGDADYWPERAPALRRLLKREQPTLLGVQEALYHQLVYTAESLPGAYEMIGYGREGGSKGEYSAIFYDARRLELLAWDQFWLSDTPKVIGSATWGNTVPRVVTWGRFRDRATKKSFVFLNTHFDHESENARARSADLIFAFVRSLEPSLPAIVTGDFNALAEQSAPYATLANAGSLRDTWPAAKERLTPKWGTFPDYASPVEGDKRIDWILASPAFEVHRAAINVQRFGGRYPSDHAAVQALLTLGDAG